MITDSVGFGAGLGTAVCWALTSICFAEAGRRFGSFRVNKLRLLMAVVLYVGVLSLTKGRLWPESMNTTQFSWLALSGWIGLVFGDGCGFKALVMIGPRLTTLLWSTSPIIASLIGWVVLGERLSFLDILGITIAFSGIAWVVTERKAKRTTEVAEDHPDAGSLVKGVLLGIGAATGQALGLVMSKQAMLDMGESVDAFSASFIRILASAVLISGLVAARRDWGATFTAVRHRTGMAWTAAGAVFGPVVGVWLSLVSAERLDVGVASTLNATAPILTIPMVVWFYGEGVSVRALVGSLTAIAGVSILFLSGA